MTRNEPESARLAITSRTTGQITVLTVRGEIDHDSAGQFHQALNTGHTASPPRIVVDLSGVTFMDSTGIQALAATHRSTRSAHGWIRIAAPDNAVLRVIQIVGLDTIVACYPTLNQAINA
ncbi:STAS domain-containing protein [Streptomyces sp. 142MFCol3.1]|uniref:STAS domain-containing protein n=1 Tax=Streptomyces sp. 142MFCol3.1 TaxID=1172179 RepID=UPI0003FC856B|nr:STAS domain-containing protein [Streptomyces sp. 142MFCol3.1]